MGQLNYSSSPLSTLFPSFSSLKEPNFNGAFLMDLGSLKSNTSPMPDYALSFTQKALPIVNSMKLKAGFATMDSSDPSTAFLGNTMASDITKSSSIFPTGTDLNSSSSLKASKSTFGKNVGAWSAGLDMASTLVSSISGEKLGYSGTYGNLQQIGDLTFDLASNLVMSINPLVGGIMKAGGLASDVLTLYAGMGTDSMTKTDAILGSKLLSLTPIGMLNGFLGETADTMTKDNDAFEKVGASYGGTNAIVDDALTKSGKKYGFFSEKARLQANKDILKANALQDIMSDIADEATNRFKLADSMAAINGNRRAFRLLGAYNPSTMRFGKNGMSLLILERAKNITSLKNILSHKNGGTIIELMPIPTEILLVDPRDVPEFLLGGSVHKKPEVLDHDVSKSTFDAWYRTVPEDRNDTILYNLRRAFELAPIEELEAWRTSSIEDLKSGKNHLRSAYLNPKTGIYEFVKSKNHPTLKYELEWYNSNDPEAILFRLNYDLDTSGEYYKYIPKNLERFEKGGSINVIPEGALHARKHNMDMEGITKKGIPVVTDKENGEIELLAEIEKEEIIFRLEVTKKLEELLKKYYNADTSQEEKDALSLEAGKLLVKEILYNTADNVNLIEKV